MKRYFFLLVATFTSLFSINSFGMDLMVEKNEMLVLKEILLKNDVKKMRIIHIPYGESTRTRVSPKNFESYKNKATEIIITPDATKELISIAEKTEYTSYDKEIDLRWAVFFINDEGNIKFSIYLSGNSLISKGRNGYFNDNKVSLDDGWVKWLEKNTNKDDL